MKTMSFPAGDGPCLWLYRLRAEVVTATVGNMSKACGDGCDLTIISVGVGVLRSIQAADSLEKEGISAGVVDLRTVSPLDKTAVCGAVLKTGRILVVDWDTFPPNVALPSYLPDDRVVFTHLSLHNFDRWVIFSIFFTSH